MSSRRPERTLVDTNILVYAHDGEDPTRRARARNLLADLWDQRTGLVSTQVLQEFHAVATRRLTPPMTPAEARQIIGTYAAWPVVGVDPELILAASTLSEQETISFWDALVVEAARRGGATILATEDLQTGRDFNGVRIMNPFADVA